MASYAQLIRMGLSKACSLLFVATFLWCAATWIGLSAAELERSGGPWMIERESGGLRIGIEFLPHQDQVLFGLLSLQSPDRELMISGEVSRTTRRSNIGERIVVSFELNAAQRLAHPVLKIAGLGADSVNIETQARPQVLEPVQVLFVGAYNYPMSDEIERVEKQLGKPIQLVVLMGAGTASRVGVGGWERRIPIMSFLPSHSNDELNLSVFGSQNEWPLGSQWGCLGLPSVLNESQILQAVNRGVFDWQIFLDRDSRWDPGLMPSVQSNASALSRILSICSRMRLPLIIGSGSGSGFVSEPLIVYTNKFAELALKKKYISSLDLQSITEDVQKSGQSTASLMIERSFINQVQASEIAMEISTLAQQKLGAHGEDGVTSQADGTRYIPANMAGLGFRGITNEIAVSMYQPALLAVIADTNQCTVQIISADRSPLILSYSHDKEHKSTGWANYNIEASLKSVINKQPLDGALHDLEWQRSEELADYLLSSFELRSVLDWAKQYDKDSVFLQRLTQMDKTIVLSWIFQNPDASLPVKRDCFLRSLEDQTLFSNSDFIHLITHQTDEYIIRGLLRAMASMPRQQRLYFIDILIKRMGYQQTGQLAMDADPMLQQALMSAIFESPFHSPTNLRPLAHFMRQNGHNLAVGPNSPIQRFFERNGE